MPSYEGISQEHAMVQTLSHFIVDVLFKKKCKQAEAKIRVYMSGL